MRVCQLTFLTARISSTHRTYEMHAHHRGANSVRGGQRQDPAVPQMQPRVSPQRFWPLFQVHDSSRAGHLSSGRGGILGERLLHLPEIPYQHPTRIRTERLLATTLPPPADRVHAVRAGRGQASRGSATNPMKSRKPIRRRSLKMASKMRQYAKIRTAFLAANPLCVACGVLGKRQDPHPAVEIHHKRGRFGSLLLNEAYFVPVCSPGHIAIHNHPDAARSAGLLCARGEWGKQ